MERLVVTPRPDWRARMEALDFNFHTIDGKTYWNEAACYRFTADEIDRLEAAVGELERICLMVVDRVVKERLFDRLGIPREAHDLIGESWQRFDRNVVGRFDLSWDGTGDPKLLEYNADTPTSLYEASVVQWDWLGAVRPDSDQFNSIHEKLIEAWRAYGLNGPLHFACVRDHAEDFGTTAYLRDTAIQAGLQTDFLHVDEIGWNGAAFVDLQNRPIRNLFKLYPWEWMIGESFARHIRPSRLHVIEPAWKMILSNKAVLPLLWETFEGHPNLLPASFDPRRIGGPCVEKPLLGREGEGVVLHRSGASRPVDGKVFQALAPLPEFGGHNAVIGAWVIASQPAGIGIREDDGPVTTNLSRFVPHYFE